MLGRDLFRVLTTVGAMRKTVDSRVGRRMMDRELLIGSSARVARRRGTRLHGRAVGAAGTTVTFADGTTLAPRTVIWATGFGRDLSWIDAPILDDRGEVMQSRGVTPAPGLHVVGLPWMHTRGSALLGWVKDDAAHIAERIAAQVVRAPTHKSGSGLRVPA